MTEHISVRSSKAAWHTIGRRVLDGDVGYFAVVDDNDSALETRSTEHTLGVQHEAEGGSKLGGVITSYET